MKRAIPELTPRHSPTPIRRLRVAGHTLWVKDDGVTHPLYGGNKPRKLEPLLAHAAQRGCDRLLTFGAVGSHHVLATALFGARAGFAVHAVLTPQPDSPRARRALAAALSAGIGYTPAGSYAAAARAALSERRSRDYLIGPGGTAVRSTRAYARAAEELLAQVERGEAPRPDVVVVANGSGGTSAGLALGLRRTGILVVGVQVSEPAALGAPLARGYARAAGGAIRVPGRLLIESAYLGAGYGRPTVAGEHARALAAAAGLQVDPTYTAKALAAALGLLGVGGAQPPGPRLRRAVALRASAGRPICVLYWHTLSAVEPDPGRTALPTDLAGLFLS